MRKIDCISFFPKKLTIFVSKFLWENRAVSQNCKTWPTQLALKRCVRDLDAVVGFCKRRTGYLRMADAIIRSMLISVEKTLIKQH